MLSVATYEVMLAPVMPVSTAITGMPAARALLMAGAMPAESTGAMAMALTLRVIMSSTMANCLDNSPFSAASSMNLTPGTEPAFLAPPLIRVQPSLVLPLVM